MTWPFVVWGLNLLEPIKKVPGCFTHLLIAVDKFTKWVKTGPLAKISSKHAISFVQDIVFRFGVPNSIITGKGTQFTGQRFMDLCDDNNI
jgi:hypothetical protein